MNTRIRRLRPLTPPSQRTERVKPIAYESKTPGYVPSPKRSEPARLRAREVITFKSNKDAPKAFNTTEQQIKSGLKVKKHHYFLRMMHVKQAESRPILYRQDHVFEASQLPVISTRSQRAQGFFKVKLEDSALKVLKYAQHDWLKQRKVTTDHAKALDTFLEVFFQQLDKDSQGFIQGDQTIKELVDLGMTSNSQLLGGMLADVLRTDSVHTTKITKETLVTCLKLDQRSERMLSVFARACAALQPSIREHTGLVRVKECIALVSKWWGQLKGKALNRVSVQEVAHHCALLGMFSDYFESKTYIKSVIGLKGRLGYSDFQSLFTGVILKGALIELSKRLMRSQSTSPQLDLSSYKRALIMRKLRKTTVKALQTN